jgi:hypothetical protein
MTTPTTEAGRAVVDATASDPFVPDTQKALLRAAALRTVLAIEAEAALDGMKALDHVVAEAVRDVLLALRAEVVAVPVLMREMFGTDLHDITDLVDRAAVLDRIDKAVER